jgi:hypothetical protein
MLKHRQRCIPPVLCLLLLLPLYGSQSSPDVPVIRNITLESTNGTVDFDLFNGSAQNLAGWRVMITFYAADGTVGGKHWESVNHDDPDEMLKPGASKHYEWGLSKLDGAWPTKMSVEVNAYLLADNTAYGDEAGIREWVRDRNAALRIARRTVELLEEIKVSSDPRGTIKRELQKLPPGVAVPAPEREIRYALTQADEMLKAGRTEALRKYLDLMRKLVSAAERPILRGRS